MQLDEWKNATEIIEFPHRGLLRSLSCYNNDTVSCTHVLLFRNCVTWLRFLVSIYSIHFTLHLCFLTLLRFCALQCHFQHSVGNYIIKARHWLNFKSILLIICNNAIVNLVYIAITTFCRNKVKTYLQSIPFYKYGIFL